MDKWIQFIVGEISGAIVFVILIILVSTFQEAVPNYPITVEQILILWGLFGIATPVIVFSGILEELGDIIRSLR